METFEIACRLAEVATDLDECMDYDAREWMVERLHDAARFIAGDRVDEIYPADD